MAITAYTGVPGSGKSYALVAEVIVPGVRAGRRVLTNVEGIKPELVAEYVRKKWPRLEHVGEVQLFDPHRTLEPGFWPSVDEPNAPSLVRAGDLVVFDEVRMFWPRRGRFPPSVMKFLRYHRHFVSAETHQSTDIVVASQLATDFHEDFRGCIERSYKFRKLKAVGLAKRYTWHTWEGAEQRKGQSVGRGGGRYQNEISALYSSYKGGVGKEAATDRRENVLAQPRVLLMMAATIAVLIASVWFLWSFFHPHPKSERASATAIVAAAPPVAVTPIGAVPTDSAAVPTVNGAPPVSQVWRISGMIETPGMRVVVLVDRAGNTRYEDPSGFSMVDGRPSVGIIDGQRVLPIGMQAASASSSPFAGVVR
ncbi:zonular occludens toxin domain-containing protein [Sphingomonas sp. BK069]|uniref:zonular occludens toxin domain-containing protein n=1 Tax=Sphingomonas sp. BK069 TaxID=2586979 RepID=UPI0016082FAF|nr:zonular occludens toxin domain-containing protein [Sphingomonas sp. BK069]MBB3345959.1 zona occludens toxin [Sphingomonas sp. BK069]